MKSTYRLSPCLQEIARFFLDHTHVRLQPSGAKAVSHVLHLLVALFGLRGVHHIVAKHGPGVSRVHFVLAQSFVLRVNAGKKDWAAAAAGGVIPTVSTTETACAMNCIVREFSICIYFLTCRDYTCRSNLCSSLLHTRHVQVRGVKPCFALLKNTKFKN